LAPGGVSQSLVVKRYRVDFFQGDAVEIALHNRSFFGETENRLALKNGERAKSELGHILLTFSANDDGLSHRNHDWGPS
jgi:hypothetical protein